MSEYEENAENVEDSRECEAMRKMFVGGINRETTDEVFFDYFSQFGNMTDKVIIRDPQTKASKGFGFITYDQSEGVENVFKSRPHIIDGKTLDAKRAMPRTQNRDGNSNQHSKTTKLFIGGISEALTPEELQAYIESRHPTEYGTVEKIDFLKERETNKNKGFGFLECSSTDFADRLVICEASFLINGKKMALKKAEPKNEQGGRGGRGGRGSRGGFSSRGGRGRGGFGGNSNFGGQQNGGSYGAYYDNSQAYGGQQHQGYGNGGGYGQDYMGYNQQQQQTGWNSRFQPY